MKRFDTKAAWRPKFGELFAVFEDDAEVSSQWYRWLVAMWQVYGEHVAQMCMNLPNVRMDVVDLCEHGRADS